VKKSHLLRCAQSLRVNVLKRTPLRINLSRASHLNLFDRPARSFFNGTVGTAGTFGTTGTIGTSLH
jgi:hypothetical protein